MGSIHASADAAMPATKHFVLAALRRGRLPQFQELHPGASERHSCPPPSSTARSKAGPWTRRGGASRRPNGRLAQSRTSAPRTRSGARDCVNCAHSATQNSAAPLNRPTSCTPLARCSRDRSSQSPLPKTPSTQPWQRRQTTKTTRRCQTHRLSWS